MSLICTNLVIILGDMKESKCICVDLDRLKQQSVLVL